MNDTVKSDKKVCSRCGSATTRMDRRLLKDNKIHTYEHWGYHKGRLVCANCFDHFHNKRKIRFKNKRIRLKENPRKGTCSRCKKVRKTEMHHEKYDESDPLANTEELCSSCHKLRYYELLWAGKDEECYCCGKNRNEVYRGLMYLNLPTNFVVCRACNNRVVWQRRRTFKK